MFSRRRRPARTPKAIRTAALRRLVRPSLEGLEDRCVPSVSLSSTQWTAIGPAPINQPAGTNISGGFDGFGPVSGRVTGLAIDPTNASIIYAATAGGGVWKTTDGGNTWNPLTDNVTDASGNPVVQFMGAIALAPSNPQVLYAGTGEGGSAGFGHYGEGILVSTDGGQSWKLTGQNVIGGLAVHQIAVDPKDPNTAWVATNNIPANGGDPNFVAGVFKTTDGGITWTDVTANAGSKGVEPWSSVVVDPTTSTAGGGQATLFAANGDPFGSFTNVNGVYESTDSGQTWTFLGQVPKANTGSGRISLAISHPAGQANATLYAAVATAINQSGQSSLLAFDVSTDGGKTWTQKTGTPDFLQGLGGDDNVLVADPNNPQVVYAAGSYPLFGPFKNGIVASSDGGNTWTDLSVGTAGNNGPHDNFHALAVDAQGRLVAGSDGGAWRLDSNQPGNIAWTDLNTSLGNVMLTGIALDPGNPGNALAGSQNNTIEQFTGSTAWNAVDFAGRGKVLIDPTNSQLQYHLFAGASPARSKDGGLTFTNISGGINQNDPADDIAPFVMDPNNPQRLLVGTNRLYVTTDGGGSGGGDWTALGTAPDGQTAIDAIAVAPSDSKTIYVSTGISGPPPAPAGKVFVSTDGGTTWKNISPTFTLHDGVSSSHPILGIAVDPTNSQTAYVVIDTFTQNGSQRVFQTTNGGTSWTDITGNLPAFPVASVALIPSQNEVLVGTDVGVYATTKVNGSSTQWSRFQSGLPNARVTGLAFDSKNNILAASTFGRGGWEIKIGNEGGTLSVQPSLPTGMTEGKSSGKVTIATFTDNSGNVEPITNYSATVNWGDGTTDTLTSANGGIVNLFSTQFALVDSHAFAEEGFVPVSIAVTDTDGASGSATANATVSDAAVSITGLTAPSTPAVGVSTGSITLAMFTDADSAGAAADYTAIVSWGDGQTSTLTGSGGGIVAGSGGTFSVVASHTYAQAGSLTFSVSVADAGGSLDSKSGTVTVTGGGGGTLSITAVTPPAGATEGSATAAATLATFTDSGSGVTAGTFTATVSWGDGTTGTLTAANGGIVAAGSSFAVVGSHAYAEEGTGLAFSVTVTDASGVSATQGASLSVSDATLSLTAAPVQVPENEAAVGVVVATFTDADAQGTASDYTAAVTWQGPSGPVTTAGQVVAGPGHTFSVIASSPFAFGEEGAAAASVSVTVRDAGGASASATNPVTVTDAALTGTPVRLQTTEGGTLAQVAVGSFTDSDPQANVNNYTATVTFVTDPQGDTATTQGTVVAGPGNTFTVQATLAGAFSAPGTYAVTVVVHDLGGASTTISSQAVVSDAPLAASGQPLPTVNEGSTPTGLLLAVFVDTAGVSENDPTNYTATITWDDGGSSHTSTGTIVSAGTNTFQVFGDDTVPVAETGTRIESVTITDNGGATATATTPLTVMAAQPLVASGTSISATEGITFTGVVGTVVDPNLAGGLAQQPGTVLISWGDGGVGTGTVIPEGGGVFAVSGGHTFADEGAFQVSFTYTDAGGGATATGFSQASVGDAPLGGLTVTPPAALAGQQLSNFAVARFADANPFAAAGDFSAAISWGDGAVSGGSVVRNGDGTFSVLGSHTYGGSGTMVMTVTVHDKGGAGLSGSAAFQGGGVSIDGANAMSPAPVGGLAAYFDFFGLFEALFAQELQMFFALTQAEMAALSKL
jgi:hypothetical protein